MKFTILSIFPEILRGYFETSIMARAVERGLVGYDLVDIRDFASDKHRTVDDAPYGGGAGMIFKPEPLGRALDSVSGREKTVVFPTPAAPPLTGEALSRYAQCEELVLICGRYEGIDQRIVDYYVDEVVSIGDYVISSGEVAALVVIDGVYRLLPEVISESSLRQESHSNGLLEYPQYTRPEEFRGMRVPSVLLSGHHAEIERWRMEQSRERTRVLRPDMYERFVEEEGD